MVVQIATDVLSRDNNGLRTTTIFAPDVYARQMYSSKPTTVLANEPPLFSKSFLYARRYAERLASWGSPDSPTVCR